MAKNMYQKREMRKNKRINEAVDSDLNKSVINWYIPTYGKTLANAYK